MFITEQCMGKMHPELNPDFVIAMWECGINIHGAVYAIRGH